MSEFLQPSSLAEALHFRAAHPNYELLAGGTDLLVASKNRQAPAGTIDLFGLRELAGICESDAEGGGLRIGAATTYAELLADARIAATYPVLRAACREVGAAQIQARGTIGGNIATSSPVGDSLPPLLALDAEIELASETRARRVPYRLFLTGYRQTDIAADELLVAIHVPKPHADSVQYWRKIGTRRAQSISKVMLAAVGHVEGANIASVRIALGAVADRPVRAYKTEAAVLGQPPSTATAELAREVLRSEITPIGDLRSTAQYRLQVAENIVARFLQNLA
jgi:xanthine dehydrogenase small subunit